MIKDLVQQTLDDALYPDILVYDQRKTGNKADEYVVYTLSGDTREFYADDKNQTRSASVTVKYFYRTTRLDHQNTRRGVRETEDLIETTLEAVGFEIPFGRFDAGDVDDIGYYCTVFECEYWRLV